MNKTDEELILLLRSHNVDLYAEIIERYELRLSRYLRKFIVNFSDIEDLLQEIFLKAYQNLNNFDVSKKFSSWIYRISHNEAVNFLKRQKIDIVQLDDIEFSLFDSSINFEKEFDQKLDKIRLEKALAKLDLKYLEPLIFYHFEDKSYDEIADILKIPVSSVGTLILRAKTKLKHLI